MKTRGYILLSAILIQLCVLGSTWQRAYYPSDPEADSEWKRIKLELAPVDPRSLFQGHYVQLRLGINSVPRSKITANSDELRRGSPIYLKLEEVDGVYQVAEGNTSQPTDGLFIKGIVQSYWSGSSNNSVQVTYGIEQFYAPKERAEQLENQTRRWGNGPRAKFVAFAVLNSEGRAGLVDIELAEK